MSKSYNSNIKYNGVIYHIQTEVLNNNIITHVFDKGKVIFSFKSDFVDYAQAVKQHKIAEAAAERGRFEKNDKTI